jgi:hypothetical protein
MSSKTTITCDVCGDSIPEHLAASRAEIFTMPQGRIPYRVALVDLCGTCLSRITGRGLSRVLRSGLDALNPKR